MPITVNDCKHCGALPHFGFDDMGGGYADLILYCDCPKREKYHEAKGGALRDTIEEWNSLNSKI